MRGGGGVEEVKEGGCVVDGGELGTGCLGEGGEGLYTCDATPPPTPPPSHPPLTDPPPHL